MDIDAFDRQGNKLDASEWLPLFNDSDYQQLKLTEQQGIRVSTVWLGIAHGRDTVDNKPFIFETMVFLPGDQTDCVRSTSEEQALGCHEDMCDYYFRILPDRERLKKVPGRLRDIIE